MRAAEAAEALSAEGVVVTARAVRARSGVRMTVAAEAARVWNERESQAGAVPDLPAVVQARFTAVWREAFTAARAEFEQARAGWLAKVAQVEAERDGLAEEIEHAEAAREEALRETVTVREQAAQAAAESAEVVAGERSRADKAEARLEAVGAERDRVIGERDREQVRREAAENEAKRLEAELSAVRESIRAVKGPKS